MSQVHTPTGLEIATMRGQAEDGVPWAQTALAQCYETGRGVPRDLALAIHWYQEAAEGGEPIAQDALALAYARGRGVARDFARAAEWNRKARNQKNRQADGAQGWGAQALLLIVTTVTLCAAIVRWTLRPRHTLGIGLVVAVVCALFPPWNAVLLDPATGTVRRSDPYRTGFIIGTTIRSDQCYASGSKKVGRFGSAPVYTCIADTYLGVPVDQWTARVDRKGLTDTLAAVGLWTGLALIVGMAGDRLIRRRKSRT